MTHLWWPNSVTELLPLFFFCTAQKTGLLCGIRGLGEKLTNEWRVGNGRFLGFVTMKIGEVDGWIFVPPKMVEPVKCVGRKKPLVYHYFLKWRKMTPHGLTVRLSAKGIGLNTWTRLGKAAIFRVFPFSECVISVKIVSFSVRCSRISQILPPDSPRHFVFQSLLRKGPAIPAKVITQ